MAKPDELIGSATIKNAVAKRIFSLELVIVVVYTLDKMSGEGQGFLREKFRELMAHGRWLIAHSKWLAAEDTQLSRLNRQGSGRRFRHVVVTIFFIAILLLSAGRPVDAEDTVRIKVLPSIVKQGEVCVVTASGPGSMKSAYGVFRGENFSMVFEEQNGTYVGLLGIDMEIQPARYEVKVGATDGKGTEYSSAHSLKVEKVDFGVQRLSLPSHMVDLDAKTLQRVNKESRQLKALFQAYRDERVWRGAFIRPVDGELSASFGLRRIMNDQPRSPHTGIDLVAEEGTPVLASNSAVAVLVDELFFGGKSVILDHGCGIYSMYFHLSEVLVVQGDRVSKEAILGRVGTTGRSTRPHLHWGIRMNGARVDPLSLLRLTEHLRE